MLSKQHILHSAIHTKPNLASIEDGKSLLQNLSKAFSRITFYESAYDSGIEKSSHTILTCGAEEEVTINTKSDFENLSKAIKEGLPNISIIDKSGNIPQEVTDIASSIFGYFEYEAIQFFENSVTPNTHKGTIDMPTGYFVVPEYIAITEAQGNKSYIFGHSEDKCQEFYQTYFSGTSESATAIASQQEAQPPSSQNIPELYKHQIEILGQTFHSSTSEEGYKQKVKNCINHIIQGDVFQVVPSIRIVKQFNKNPIDMYYSLRSVNPSPFMVFCKYNQTYIVGSSPEILVRVNKNKVTIRPLAGTRKRGKTDTENKELAQDLLSDTKEIAEHLMLIDLARNDTGRVAIPNSVTVPRQMEIELYSHVMHISSTVTGSLDPEKTTMEALFSGFPAGTVSGAPKIKSMQILSEIEPHTRSMYSGCMGYISPKVTETCILLRTCVIQDNIIYIQAGAGVVYDSIPESEYQECVNKMKALVQAYINA